jgi:acyl carrier protein
MSERLQGVKEVIADVIKIDMEQITPETRFIEDLKADSMDQLFLSDGFCEKFDINISDDEARSIHTVQDVLDYLDENL